VERSDARAISNAIVIGDSDLINIRLSPLCGLKSGHLARSEKCQLRTDAPHKKRHSSEKPGRHCESRAASVLEIDGSVSAR